MRRPLLVLSVFLFALGLLVTGSPSVLAQEQSLNPENLRVTVNGSDNVTLVWEDPSSYDQTIATGYVLTGFELQWRLYVDGQDDAAGWGSLHTTSESSKTYMPTGLQPNTSYDFRVRTIGRLLSDPNPATSVRYSFFTYLLNHQTAQSVPGAPTLVAQADGDGAVGLSWSLSDTTGVTSWRYEYKQTSAADWTGASGVDVSDVATLTADVSGLLVDPSYDFRVRAVASGVGGDWSTVESVAGKPFIPQNLGATASTSAVSINVHWDFPSSTGGADLTGYTVQWRPHHATGNWADQPATGSRDVVPTATSVDITAADGLAAGTNYNFRISAYNAHRRSFFTPNDGSVAAATISQAASISATTPETLKEGNLDGAKLTVDLVGATYVQNLESFHPETILTFSPPVSGLRARSVERVDDDTAVLTLAYDYTDAAMTGDTDIAVVVAYGATSHSASLTTNTVPVGHFVNATASLPATASVNEGDAVSVELTLDEPVPGSFDFTWRALESGAATPGVDFADQSSPVRLTVPAGATSVTITTDATIDDVFDEDNEQFGVFVTLDLSSISAELTNKIRLSSTASQTTVTITDNDDPPVLSVAAGIVNEGDSGTSDLPFTVTLTPASGKQVTVGYATIASSLPGAATVDEDYIAASGTLTFAPGETSKTVNVTINGDNVVEPDESVTLGLQSPTNATFPGGLTALGNSGTITNDDTAPTTITLSLDPTSVAEEAGRQNVHITAAFPDGSDTLLTDTDVTVSVGAPGDSATEGADYQTVNDFVLTILAGETSGLLTPPITPIDDSDQEGTEEITVSGTASGFTVSSATLTLTEDDIPPTTSALALSRDTVAENRGRTTLTVTLGGRTTIAETTVEVAAQAGVFTVDQASKTIAAGATSASFTLTAVPNDVDAADAAASVSVTLTGGTGDNVQQPDPASLDFTITDDDPTPRAALSVLPNPVDEADGGATVTVTATLDRPSGEATTLTVSAAPATGSNPAETEDFTLSSGVELTIAAGQTASTGTVTITANADDDSADERVTVSATAANSHGVTAPAAVILTIRDDDVPGARVTAADPVTVAEGGTATYTLVLNVQPSGDVTVRATPGGSSGVTVDTDSVTPGDQDTLTFTPTTWNTAQTVTVTGAQDDDAVDDSGSIRHAIVRASTSSEYDNIGIDAVNVAVTDDDAAGFTIDTDPDTAGIQSGPVAVEEGETAEYTVALDAAPGSGSVRISVSSSDTGAARTSRSSLTFTRSNWDDPQTVRVTGQQDADSSSETVTITHAVVAASSADEFDGLADQTVTVNVGDDETINYDSDGDGLIEVHNLAQLNAIRWDLDGNGAPASNATEYAAAFENPRDGVVCPSGTTCNGYELMADLVYGESTGAGWEPIGSISSRYNATFEGNGHAISNLYVNRAQHDVALFGALESGGEIRNVALLNVSITVSGNNKQYQRAAALVGRNFGTVRNSYVTGAISGLSHVGGVIGRSEGAASNIYAVGSVSGNGDDVAGLIGFMDLSASLRDSYASVKVANADSSRDGLGLVGWIHSSSVTVENTFFDTDVTTTDGGSHVQAGGAYRTASTPTVTNVSGQTGAELKAPTAATGIYAAWDAAIWDFGSDVQFPALKADRDGNGTATWQEFGYQVREVPDITRAVPSVDLTSVAVEWTTVTNAWTSQRPRPSFSYVVYRDDARVAPSEGRTLTQASHTDRTVTAGNDHRYVVAVEINGVELRRGAERNVNVSRDTDGDGLIEITTRQQLNAMRYDLNGDGTVDDASNANDFRPLAPVGGSACPSGTTCTGYELSNDIALSGSWTPIGGNVSRDVENPYSPGDRMFTAIFEGNGYTISGLSISLSSRYMVGLFGAIGGNSEVRNVGLTGVNVRGEQLVGALVGYVYRRGEASGTVSGSWSAGSVTGNALVGGLVGWNRGTVERSYSEATVTGFNLSDSGGPIWSTQLGGLVGANDGTVENAYATGAVRGVGHVAGLAGSNGVNGGRGTISNSYATGAVSSDKDWPHVGGLVGWQNASVSRSYWDTETSGQDEGVSQGSDEGITGLTTAGLQGPTGATGIYGNWDSATIWEFGTSSEYPCLLDVTPGCEEQTSQASRASVTVTADDPVAVNEGGSATYTVVLDGQPTGNVVVAMSSDNSDVTSQPASLTFTTGNWQTAQTVTLRASHDGDAATDAATISHSVSGADEYAGIDVDSVNVSVTDDDKAGVTVSESSLNIKEGGSATYTVVLDTQPIEDVLIYPSTYGGVTAQPSALTFTSDNWQTPQEVTVSAAQDDNTENEQVVINHGISAAAESAYASIVAPAVNVSVTDDDQAAEPAQADPPGVVVSAADPVTVREGGSAAYTVALDAQPADNVVVELSSDNYDVTATSTSLTFTADNWHTAQTVTLSAAQDEDRADEQAVITHRVSGEDETAATVNVSVIDDDSDREVLRDFYDATRGASWTNNANWLSDRPLSEWHGVTVNGQGQVTQLNLRDNNLTGQLPAELGKLTSLEVISLDRNGIGGSLPAELGNLTNLTRLALNRNQLTGAIPSELGNLTNLSIIGLARNSLSGDLPTSLGNLSGLTKLSLHDNTALSGALPGGFVNMDGMQRLAIANTGMCVPSGQAFDDWLAGIPDVPGRDGLARCGSTG